MRLLISHLTRMRYPYVCVAGNRTDRTHIRPVLFGAQLRRALLRSEGGPFSLGTVVNLGPTQPCPDVPEVEDVTFSPEKVQDEKRLESTSFGKFMKQVAESSLQDIFGNDLVRLSGTSAAVAKGVGKASLGVLQADGDVDLQSGKPDGEHEIRCTFVDKALGELSLKVTDLRLWEKDHVTPAFSKIEAIRSRLRDCQLAVGLTRFYEIQRYPGFGHWLQVNNVFPIDDPLWARE